MGKSSVVTTTNTTTQDLRTQIESLGQGSQFVGPQASVASGGSQVGGNYSQLSTTYNATGLSSDAVRQMLADQESGAVNALKEVTDLSSNILASAAGQRVATPAAADSGASKLSAYLPFIVVGGLVLLFATKRRAA
jgi:hypothetical protein